jgi:hypothetical protein
MADGGHMHMIRILDEVNWVFRGVKLKKRQHGYINETEKKGAID